MSKVFISYRWEDKSSRDSLEATMNNPNNEFFDSPLVDRQSFNIKSEIQSYLDRKLNNTSAIIAIIGDRGPDGTWMRHELKVAISKNIPIIPVRIPNTDGISPFVIQDLEIIDWDIIQIQNKLDETFGRI